ncbi:MAG: condensation domain-containing protein, partial [Gordonia paraffinivorans]
MTPGAGRLAAALDAVLATHDALRARLVVDDAKPAFLEVPAVGSVTAADVLRRVEFTDEPGTPAFVDTVQREASAANDRLDPSAGVMLQVVWFDPSADLGPDVTGRLYVVIHHLVVDGVSWRILLPDLVVAWARTDPTGGDAGTAPVELGEVGTSLRTWSHALAGTAPTFTDAIEAWAQVVSVDDPPLGSGPLDPDRDTVATMRRVSVDMPVDVSDAVLREIGPAYRTGVDTALLTALAVAVRRWRLRRGVDAPGLLVELEGHGREEFAVAPTSAGARADLHRTVGWFTTTRPVRLDLTGVDVDAVVDAEQSAPAAGAAIKAVKEDLTVVPGGHGGIGFGVLTRFGGPEADVLRGRGEPQIAFNYLGRVSAGETETAEFGWQPATDGGELGGSMDAGMVVPAALTINALATDTASGPVVSASFAFAGELLDEDDVREL